MIVTLQTQRVQTLEQLRRVAEGNEPVDFALADRASAYEFIRRTLVQFDYAALGKADKGAVKAYLAKMTGLSRAQLTRLMAQHRSTGRIRDRRSAGPSRPFTRRYTAADIRLLAEVDTALGQRCGPATRAVLRRQYEVFGDGRFARLAGLSNGHLYNLRASRTYRSRRSVFTKTRARVVAIAERRKPRPDGQPGFLRVDTVHQGDRDGAKGVYYVNTVDEVTQYEHIGCVAAISERFLVPVLETLIEAYPFAIQGFHADNGSEYINHRVARLLNKLHIGQFTKSRARHCNDNALVEGKNGAVIRGWLHVRSHSWCGRSPSQDARDGLRPLREVGRTASPNLLSHCTTFRWRHRAPRAVVSQPCPNHPIPARRAHDTTTGRSSGDTRPGFPASASSRPGVAERDRFRSGSGRGHAPAPRSADSR